MNKSIRINKNLKVNYSVECKDNQIKIHLNASNREENVITLFINRCDICGNAFLSIKENNICSKCTKAIEEYKSEKRNSVVEIITPKMRKSNYSINNYSKVTLADSNIKISNLSSLCDNLRKNTQNNERMSLQRLEAYLKFAANNNSFKTIANILNIKESSVIREYLILRKFGYIEIVDRQYPKITNKVILSSTNTPNKISANAYKVLSPYLKHWIDRENLIKVTKLSANTINKYLCFLSKDNCIIKRGTLQNREYKLAAI